MLANLLQKIMSLLVLLALGWSAWYGYTHWFAATSGTSEPAQGAAYNCRHALARLAEDYACRESDGCTLTSDQVTAMKNREVAIEQHCN